MRKLLKIGMILFVAFAIMTANSSDRAEMWEGLTAFGRSITSACTRDASPCAAAIHMLWSFVPAGSNMPLDPTRRPLDGSLRLKG